MASQSQKQVVLENGVTLEEYERVVAMFDQVVLGRVAAQSMEDLKKQSVEDFVNMSSKDCIVYDVVCPINQVDIEPQCADRYCKLCKILISGGQSMREHESGKRHQRALQASNDPHRAPVDAVYCQLCHVQSPNKYSYDEHCKGRKHRNAVWAQNNKHLVPQVLFQEQNQYIIHTQACVTLEYPEDDYDAFRAECLSQIDGQASVRAYYRAHNDIIIRSTTELEICAFDDARVPVQTCHQWSKQGYVEGTWCGGTRSTSEVCMQCCTCVIGSKCCVLCSNRNRIMRSAKVRLLVWSMFNPDRLEDVSLYNMSRAGRGCFSRIRNSVVGAQVVFNTLEGLGKAKSTVASTFSSVKDSLSSAWTAFTKMMGKNLIELNYTHVCFLFLVIFRHPIARFVDSILDFVGIHSFISAALGGAEDKVISLLSEVIGRMLSAVGISEPVRSGELVGQSGETKGAHVATASMLMCLVPSLLDNKSFVGAVVSKASTIVRGVEFANVGMEWFIEKMPEFIQDVFVQSGVWIKPTRNKELEDAIEELGSYVVCVDSGVLTMDMAVRAIELNTYLKSEVLKMTRREDGPLRTAVATVIKQFADKSSHFNEVAGQDLVPEPIAFRFYSAPGFGKTIAQKAVSMLISDGSATPAYYRNPMDKYWSGLLKQHKVLLYDDFRQNEELTTEIAAEIIGITNDTAFRPAMPGVDDKGKVHHVTAIGMTTNTSFDRMIPGVDNFAFARRFKEHSYVVECDPSVLTNGVFCSSKFAAKSKEYQESLGHLRFVRQTYTPAGGLPKFYPEATYTFPQLCMRIHFSLLVKRMEAHRRANRLHSIVDSIRERIADHQQFFDTTVERLVSGAFTRDQPEYMPNVGFSLYSETDSLLKIGRHDLFGPPVGQAAGTVVLRRGSIVGARGSGEEVSLDRSIAVMKETCFLRCIPIIYWLLPGTHIVVCVDNRKLNMIAPPFLDSRTTKFDVENAFSFYWALLHRHFKTAFRREAFYQFWIKRHADVAGFFEDVKQGPAKLPWLEYMDPVPKYSAHGVNSHAHTDVLIDELNEAIAFARSMAHEQKDEGCAHVCDEKSPKWAYGFCGFCQPERFQVAQSQRELCESLGEVIGELDGQELQEAYVRKTRRTWMDQVEKHGRRFKHVLRDMYQSQVPQALQQALSFSIVWGSICVGFYGFKKLAEWAWGVGTPQKTTRPGWSPMKPQEIEKLDKRPVLMDFEGVQSNEKDDHQKRTRRTEFISRWMKTHQSEYLQKGKSIAQLYLDAEKAYRSQTVLVGQEGDLQTKSVLERVFSQMVFLTLGARSLHGFIVRGRTLLVPRHFFMQDDGTGELEDGTVFYVRFHGASYAVAYESKNAQLFMEKVGPIEYIQDVCLYELPEKTVGGASIPVCKDLSHLFPVFFSEDQLPKYRCAVLSKLDDECVVQSRILTKFCSLETGILYPDAKASTRGLGIPRQFCYDGMKYGDCGALLIVAGSGGRLAIIGMHVAGRDFQGESIGTSIPITSYMLTKIVAQSGGGVELVPGFPKVGEINFRVSNEQMVTSYRESPLADKAICSKVTKRPAHLGSTTAPGFTTWDLLRKEMNRARPDAPRYPFDRKRSAVIVEAMFERFKRSFTQPWMKRVHKLPEQVVLSGGTALCSTCGLHHTGLQPINLKTASGFHWGYLREANGKHHLIRGEAGSREIICSKLKDYMIVYSDYLKDPNLMDDKNQWGISIHAETVQTFLKDETRSEEKTMVEDPITRMIQVFQLPHLLKVREFFGAYIDFVHSNFDTLVSAVGMNPYSSDWDTMISYMRQVGERGWDADWGKFEEILCEQIAMGFVDLVNEWYAMYDADWSPEDDVVRRNLVLKIVDNFMILGKDVVIQRGSLKSGVGLTTLIGCFMNEYLIRMSWLNVVPAEGKNDKQHMVLYDEKTRLKVFSDDHKVVVHETIEAIFNFKTVKSYFTSLGYRYTDAAKTGVDYITRSVYDLEFLKCRTQVAEYVPGSTYYAVPTKPNDYTTLKWIQKGQDPIKAVSVNACNLLSRAWALGPAPYETMRREIALALAEVGCMDVLPSWKSCKDRYETHLLGFQLFENDDIRIQNFGLNPLYLNAHTQHWFLDTFPKQTPIKPQVKWQHERIRWIDSFLDPRVDDEEDFPRVVQMEDEDKFEVQMMSAPQPQDTTLVLEIAPCIGSGEHLEPGGRVWGPGDNLMELTKRYEPIWNTGSAFTSTEQSIKTRCLIWPNTEVNGQTFSTVQYLARAFAFYYGGYRFKSDVAQFGTVSWCPQWYFPGMNEQRNWLENYARYVDAAAGPKIPVTLGGPMVRVINSGVSMWNINPWADVQFWRVPLNETMNDPDVEVPYLDNGKITWTFGSAVQSASRFWFSCDEAMGFGCLREIPPLKMSYIPPGADERKHYEDRSLRGQSGFLSADASAKLANVFAEAADEPEVEVVAGVADAAATDGGAESGNVPQNVPSVSRYGIEDCQYSIQDLAARPQFIHTLNWTTTTPLGVMATYDVPLHFIAGTVSSNFNRFHYWAGNIKVTIQVNSVFTQRGMLWYGFIRDMGGTYSSVRILSGTQGGFQQMILNNPDGFIAAGGTRTVEYIIRYVYPKIRIPTEDIGQGWNETPTTPESLGSFAICCFNTLEVAEGSAVTTVPVIIKASFIEESGCPAFTILRTVPLTTYGLKGKKPTPPKPLERQKKYIKFRPNEEKDEGGQTCSFYGAFYKRQQQLRVDARNNMRAYARQYPAGSMDGWSDVIEPQGGVMSGALHAVPNVVNVVKKGVDVASDLKGLVTGKFDKPYAMLPPHTMIMQSNYAVSETSGIDMGVHLGARYNETRGLRQTDMGTTCHELEWSHIFSQWNFDQPTVVVHPATTGLLWEMPIMPCPMAYAAANGTTIDIGPTEWAAHNFDFWTSAGFEVRIIVTRNKVSSVKLFCTVLWNAEIGPLDLETVTAGWGGYLDLADGRSEYIVRVPFRGDRVFYPITHRPPDSGPTKRYSPGIFQIYVVNELVADPIASSNIDLNVMWRLIDFKAMWPGQGISNFEMPLVYG